MHYLCPYKCLDSYHAMNRLILYIICFISLAASATMQSTERVTQYQVYSTADGVSHRVIHTMLQSTNGYLWMATWNGLCQYDGYRFRTFNKLSDGQSIGRLVHIAEAPGGDILCRTSLDKYYRFQCETKQFVPIPPAHLPKEREQAYAIRAEKDGLAIIHQSDTFFLPIHSSKDLKTTLHATCKDQSGNLWVNCNDALYKISFPNKGCHHHTTVAGKGTPAYGAEIRASLTVGGTRWLASKKGHIYIYDSQQNLIGCLSPQGIITPEASNFGADIYDAVAKGEHIWLASKGEGLYMLAPFPNKKAFRIRRWKTINGDTEIYSLAFDDEGNLWIGCYNKGLYKIPSAHNYSLPPVCIDTIARIRHLQKIDGHIMAATQHGLFIYDQNGKREQHLDSFDCSYICQDKPGKIYVATMGFGLHVLKSNGRKWNLQPCNIPQLSTGSILSIAKDKGGNLYFICDNSIVRLSPRQDTQRFGSNYFGENIAFSEADPFINDSTLWAGTTDGYMEMNLNIPAPRHIPFHWEKVQVDRSAVTINNSGLTIKSNQEVTLMSAAIDFGYMGNIQYKYRMDTTATWITLENDRTIKLSGLKTGKHLMELRYTDSKGIWTDRIIKLPITVRPSRSNAKAAFIILMAIIIIGSAVLAIYRMQAKKKEKQSGGTLPEPATSPFIAKAKEYILANISDDSLNVERLCEHLGVSRSILYQRIKEDAQKTPAQLIKECRIEEAIKLLHAKKYSITEIADMTGFCDAKYFSKVFKKETGKSPSTYFD